MKLFRKVIAIMTVFVLCMVLAVPAFAETYAVSTNPFSVPTVYYGTLSGSSRLVGDHVNTLTQVTSNNYNGTVYTKIEMGDGISNNFAPCEYRSAVGARSLSNITYLLQDMNGAFVAKYVFSTHEIRGGTKEGDWRSITLQVR